MKASVEILSGIVRVGPDHARYGDDYDVAAAFSSTDGRRAVLKGLTSDDQLEPAHVRAAMAAVEALGLIPVWIRLKKKKPRAKRSS